MAAATSRTESDGAATIAVTGVDAAAVTTALAAFFASEGYRLEEGTAANGAYGKGSPLKRLLLGSLAKRYKFSVNVTSADTTVEVAIGRGMSGTSGGLMGRSQMKKELERIADGAERWFAQHL